MSIVYYLYADGESVMINQCTGDTASFLFLKRIFDRVLHEIYALLFSLLFGRIETLILLVRVYWQIRLRRQLSI